MRQEVRFCTASDGVRIAYAINGAGPPLVRTATWLTHREFDWESSVWQHWLEGLADGKAALRHHGCGCGLSDRPLASLIPAARLSRTRPPPAVRE